jgi:hypothetical protein
MTNPDKAALADRIEKQHYFFDGRIPAMCVDLTITDVERDLIVAALRASDSSPSVPGVEPHIYSPDYQAMGDCRVCGHAHNKPWHLYAPSVLGVEREKAIRECAKVANMSMKNAATSNGILMANGIERHILALIEQPGDKS